MSPLPPSLVLLRVLKCQRHAPCDFPTEVDFLLSFLRRVIRLHSEDLAPVTLDSCSPFCLRYVVRRIQGPPEWIAPARRSELVPPFPHLIFLPYFGDTSLTLVFIPTFAFPVAL